MTRSVHTIDFVDKSSQAQQDRLLVGIFPGLANVAGSGAGAAVTIVVTAANLPANYVVSVDPRQDATYYTSAHTATGFNVVLNPRLAANTLAAGTIDVTVMA